MKIGFDNQKYLTMQSEHIRERISKFGDKLYLEANKVMNEDGVELVLEKGKTETITEEEETEDCNEKEES